MKKILTLLLAFVLIGFMGCSIGTDKSTPLPEKSLSQLRVNTEKPFFESKSSVVLDKQILPEGSETKLDGHPQVDNKTIPRKTVVPSEVKNRWRAVKLLILNKKEEEIGRMQIVELGTRISPVNSELMVVVGPFLPNFMMNKSAYTSMGNEELNPAVQLVVEENGKIIYKGWAFKNFPTMYAFEHQDFSIKLIGAIPAVAF